MRFVSLKRSKRCRKIKQNREIDEICECLLSDSGVEIASTSIHERFQTHFQLIEKIFTSLKFVHFLLKNTTPQCLCMCPHKHFRNYSIQKMTEKASENERAQVCRWNWEWDRGRVYIAQENGLRTPLISVYSTIRESSRVCSCSGRGLVFLFLVCHPSVRYLCKHCRESFVLMTWADGRNNRMTLH